MAQQTQVRRIEIKIDTQGDRTLQTVANGFKKMNNSIQQSTGVLTSFRNAFFAIQGLSFAGIGITQITQAADAMQKLNDRLVISEGSIDKASFALKGLAEISKENYVGIEDTAVIYNRLNLSLRETGISTEALLGLTDSLQKTFRLSGATAAEATAATIQMSQGLASGQLRGQELRSVLEGNVEIGRLLARQLGVTRGQLLKFAEKEGGISATDTIKALSSGMAELNAQAKNLRPTISEGLANNITDLKIKLNDLNKAFGITDKVVSAIDFVFRNLDIAAVILGLAAAYKGYTLAVKSATIAQIAFNTSLEFLLASKLTGYLVKIAQGATLAAAGWATLTAAVVAATGYVIYQASTNEEWQKSLRKVADATGLAEAKSKSMTEQFYEDLQAKKKAKYEADELAKKTNVMTQSFVLSDNALGEWYKGFKDTINLMANGEVKLSAIQEALSDYAITADNTKSVQFEFKKEVAKLNEEYDKGKMSLSDYTKKYKELQIGDLNQDWKDGALSVEQYNKKLEEIQLGKLKTNVKQTQFDMRELNAQFAKNQDISAYARALNDVQLKRFKADAKEGKSSILDMNKAIRANELEEFNIQLANSEIKLTEFNRRVRENQVKTLDEQFKSGTMSVYEYNDALTKTEEKFQPSSALFVGTANYIQQAGTISQNVANLVTQTFGRLEDTMVEFTKTGKVNFREFTMAVLDDLNRIIIRSLIIRPLAQGILGAIPVGGPDAAGGTTGYSSDYMAGNTGGYAKGGAFNNGAQFFASGGIVNRTTSFGMSNGRMGIMGEAGPEAILPLTRSANGDLGVKSTPSNVTVNVINQTGAETTQTERTTPSGEKVIDILIVNKVKEGLASGAFDRQFANQYGLRRKGV